MKTNLVVISLAVLIMFMTGCGSSPDAKTSQQQEKVLSTYLEGLRDQDKTKLWSSAHRGMIAGWPRDPEELKKYLKDSQRESTGVIKSWEFEKNPYVDEVNGQAIIRAQVLTEKYLCTMDFDLRKIDQEWKVYGTENVGLKGLNDKQLTQPSQQTQPR